MLLTLALSAAALAPAATGPAVPVRAAVLVHAACVAPDDLVPTAIEAALSAPDDPVALGLPILLDGEPVATRKLGGVGRCVLDVGDRDGDAGAELAVGLGPGAPGDTLLVLDGATGETLWSARPGGGAFRSLRGLALDGARLAAGVASTDGRVSVRDAATGAVLWTRDLATTPGASTANVLSVAWVDDRDGDEVADLLVAGGHRIAAALLLSGADGATLWTHAPGATVQDAQAVHDLDGDGADELLVVGGEGAPFARLVDGATGALIWEQPLDGPGSVGLGMDDVDGDGVPDVVVGQYAEPSPCVLALRGDDGTRIWSTFDVRRDVTSLARLHDTLGTGLSDVAVGSFDNAINVVLALNGGTVWRREASTFNGASMFSVAVTDDLDGNGTPEVVSSSLDHRVYLHGGTLGQFMAMWESGRKLAAVAPLADLTGDGRPEIIATGTRQVAVVDGSLGLASGPLLDLTPPPTIDDELQVAVWSYPTTQVVFWGSLGTDAIVVPGIVGTFGLDLATLLTVFQGPTPGAGAVTLSVGPAPPSAIGLEIFTQAVSIYSPTHAILSNVESFVVPP